MPACLCTLQLGLARLQGDLHIYSYIVVLVFYTTAASEELSSAMQTYKQRYKIYEPCQVVGACMPLHFTTRACKTACKVTFIW